MVKKTEKILVIENPTPELIERFENKFQPEPNSGCWIWEACLFSDGYGQFGYNYKNYRAHRFSYALYNGPVPSNLIIRHTCDNPLCVNPAHLLLGTIQDNYEDMVKRDRRVTCRGMIRTESAKKKMSISKKKIEHIKGTKNPKYNPATFKFTHENGEEFIGTMYNFYTSKNLKAGRVHKMNLYKSRSYNGWRMSNV